MPDTILPQAVGNILFNELMPEIHATLGLEENCVRGRPALRHAAKLLLTGQTVSICRIPPHTGPNSLRYNTIRSGVGTLVANGRWFPSHPSGIAYNSHLTALTYLNRTGHLFVPSFSLLSRTIDQDLSLEDIGEAFRETMLGFAAWSRQWLNQG